MLQHPPLPQVCELDKEESWKWILWTGGVRGEWTTRKTNQWVPAQTDLGLSQEAKIIRLHLSYFGHFLGKPESLGNSANLGKVEGRRKKGKPP